jgi:hypothetical protein
LRAIKGERSISPKTNGKFNPLTLDAVCPKAIFRLLFDRELPRPSLWQNRLSSALGCSADREQFDAA